ncbi:hypothetical protein M2436_005691 [Streptomyces sp. HB372]|nr:hypothetical protein [Streptomyces sp. HB372]
MGFLDNLKAKLGPAKDKVGDLAQQHGGKIEQGLDKAARTVDQKTKGKYSDKIDSGTRKAKEGRGQAGEQGRGRARYARRPRHPWYARGYARQHSSAAARFLSTAAGDRRRVRGLALRTRRRSVQDQAATV